jgi:hypothetical protein
LKDVPREALTVGLAGVIPYLATSLTTVYLSFDIQYAANHGQGFILSGETAEQLLHIIEPIQLGYGASVSWFLPQDNVIANRCRSFLSSVLFIGALNGRVTEATKAILDTPWASLLPPLLGPLSYSPPRSV